MRRRRMKSREEVEKLSGKEEEEEEARPLEIRGGLEAAERRIRSCRGKSGSSGTGVVGFFLLRERARSR